jgi:hypothetical protein
VVYVDPRRSIEVKTAISGVIDRVSVSRGSSESCVCEARHGCVARASGSATRPRTRVTPAGRTTGRRPRGGVQETFVRAFRPWPALGSVDHSACVCRHACQVLPLRSGNSARETVACLAPGRVFFGFDSLVLGLGSLMLFLPRRLLDKCSGQAVRERASGCQGCFYEVKGTPASRLRSSREMWRLSARIASRLVFPSLMRRSR